MPSAAQFSAGVAETTGRQYLLRVKSLIGYAHRLGPDVEHNPASRDAALLLEAVSPWPPLFVGKFAPGVRWTVPRSSLLVCVFLSSENAGIIANLPLRGRNQ
jgi:hypothetical protein